MRWIASHSSELNSLCRTFTFHLPLEINSLTLCGTPSPSSLIVFFTRHCGRPGTQGSFQILVFHPSPTTRHMPFRTRLLTDRIDHHVKLMFEFAFASKKVVEGKYLAFTTRVISELGIVRIRQACFANKALLNTSKFLIPMPPLFSIGTSYPMLPKLASVPSLFGPRKNFYTFFQFHP